MYNLQLNTKQEFSVGPINKFPYQDWAFSPENYHYVTSLIGQPLPPNIALQTQIRNYIAALGTDTYVEYYVDFNTRYYPSDLNISWINATGVIPDAPGEGYLLTETNLNVVTTLAFQNIDLLTEGDFVVELEHIIKGKTAAGVYEIIETIDYVLHIVRVPWEGINTEPYHNTYFHVIGNPLPSSQPVELTVNGTFTITAPEHIALSGGNIILDNTTNGIKTYTGSGSQTLQAVLENTIENLGELISPYTANITATNSSGAEDNVLIRVYQFITATYDVSPSVLNFFAIKNISEAPAQVINIDGYGTYTVTGPSWLNITPISGENSAIINVQPIDSGNLTEGIYVDVITISTSEGDFTVAVQHKIVDRIDLGVKENVLNFTRDRKTISTLYGDDSNIIEFEVTTQVFDYNVLLLEERINNFKKGIFNHTADFFLGNIVEKTMKQLLTLESIGLSYFPNLTNGIGASTGLLGGTVYKYYNPSITKFKYTFKLRSTGDETFGDVAQNIKFIKGRKPLRINNKYGILDFNSDPIRVTKNSITLLNMYRSIGLSTVKIFKNSVLVNIFNLDHGTNQIFAMRLDFSNTTPGDVIEAKFYDSPNNDLKKKVQKYIVFPDGKHSYHIGWENEHGVLELYEFTGDYAFSTKHDEVIATTFSNYLEQLNKYESEKELTFNANTGWLLQSNQERIDSLIASSRAWIIFKENRVPINLIPRTSKIINSDSEKGQYEYNVKFTINPQHEFENNTF